MNTGPNPFNRAEHTARTWLANVAAGIGTTDGAYAYRAWLHVVRDRTLFSPGQLDHALAPLPRSLRALLRGRSLHLGAENGDRLDRLEDAVAALTEAVTELARGMEPDPRDEPDTGRATQAARRAHQVVLGIEPSVRRVSGHQ